MTHMRTVDVIDRIWAGTPFGGGAAPVRQSVLVVRDDDKNNSYLYEVCEFLDIGVEHASSLDNLEAMLPGLRPMAIIADLESEVQDGYHVMKIAAKYDRALPVLLLSSNEPVLLGAIDAVQEVWGLKRVATVSRMAGVGALVDFICHAARDAGMSRLMRV